MHREKKGSNFWHATGTRAVKSQAVYVWWRVHLCLEVLGSVPAGPVAAALHVPGVWIQQHARGVPPITRLPAALPIHSVPTYTA